MPITLQVGGTEYTNFTSANVTVALDTLANDFIFEAVAPSREPFPIKGGAACTVLVDGELVLTGFVENVAGNYTSSSHTIIVSGRDRTGDFIDSSIDVIDDIRGDGSLKSLIERVALHVGVPIGVVDSANPAPFNKAEDIISPESGSNAFTFVEQYAQKRQVLLSSTSLGNIEIISSQSTPSGGAVQNVVDGGSNNVLEASWTYSTTGLFNKYIQKGQQDPSALGFGGASSAEGVVAQAGSATDKDVRTGRQLVTVAAEGFSNEQLKLRAQWSKKIRQTRSLTYFCTVHGFTNFSGELWKPNTLASVKDEFADINRTLLINSVQYSYGARGSTTRLTFVEQDAYKLQLNEPVNVGNNQDDFKL